MTFFFLFFSFFLLSFFLLCFFFWYVGLIGAGKTTLATALGKVLGLPVYYEPVQDNEYLADFYKETAKYSFPMQVCLILAYEKKKNKTNKRTITNKEQNK